MTEADQLRAALISLGGKQPCQYEIEIAADKLILAVVEHMEREIWGLIERVLATGACLSKDTVSGTWCVYHRAPDDYIVQGENSTESAIIAAHIKLELKVED